MGGEGEQPSVEGAATESLGESALFERTLAALDVPPRLVGELASAGIDSFAAARQQRVDVATLPDISPGAASKLAAHIRLTALSSDAELNTRLVDAGVSGPVDLAGRDERELANQTGVDAELIHPLAHRARLYRASARALLAEAALAPAAAGVVGPAIATGDSDPGLCPPWRSALSPAAYLADLVDFLLDSFPSLFPDLGSLDRRFLRPFGSLPLSRASVEGSMRQVLIANEVLARFAGSRDLWHTHRSSTLSGATWQPFADADAALGQPPGFTETSGSVTEIAGGFTDIAAVFAGFNLHLCAISASGRLWHAILGPNGVISPFVDVEALAGERGTCATVACAGLADGTLHVCLVTTDGHLWHVLRPPNGVWQSLSDVENATVGIGDRGTFATVSCSTMPTGELHVCGATREGRLWHTIRQTNGSWLAPTDVEAAAGEHGTFVSVGASYGAGNLHVCGVTTDGHLWYTRRSSTGAWTPFVDVETVAGERGSFVRVVCWAMPYDEVEVIGITSDGQLWHAVRQYNGPWLAFVNVEATAGDRGKFTGAACAMHPSGELHLYATAPLTRDDLYAGFAVSSAGYPRPDVLATIYDAYLGELGTSRTEVGAAFRAAYPASGSADRTLLDDLLGRLGVPEASLTAGLNQTAANLATLDQRAPTIRQVDVLPDFVRLVRTNGIDGSDPLQIAVWQDASARAESAIERVLERTLVDLRANLIFAVLRNSTTFTSTRDLGNYLHIDLSVDASARTSRVAEAMEALQSYVLGYQLGRETASLATSRADFEARWRWLQSYGLWQAAQTVFLYPEQFLLPRVRRSVSPQFSALLDQLDEDSSPASVVAAAAAYADAVPWGLPIGTCHVGNRVVVYGASSVRSGPFIGVFNDDGEWMGWTPLPNLVADFNKDFGTAQFLGMAEWSRLLYVFFGIADTTRGETTVKYLTFNLTAAGLSAQGGAVNASQTIPSIFPRDGYATRGVGFIPAPDGMRIYACPANTLNVYVLRSDGDLHSAGAAQAMPGPMTDVVGAVDTRHYLLCGAPDTKYWLAEFDATGRAAMKTYDLGSFALPPGSLAIQGRSVRGAIQNGKVRVLATLTAGFDWGATGPLPNPTNVNRLTTFTPSASGGSVDVPVVVTMPGPYFGALSMQAFGDRLEVFYFNQHYELSPDLQGGWSTAGPLWESWFPNASDATVGRSRMARPASADGLPDYYTRYRQEQLSTFATYSPGNPAYLYLEEYYLFIPLIAAEYLSEAKYFAEADSWLRLLYNPLAHDVGGPIIYTNLAGGGSAGYEYRDSLAWLRDPFNPYLIARTRQGAFLRHAIYQYAANLLDWADAEFARDSAESINRARELYELAEDILAVSDVPQDPDGTAWRALLADVPVIHPPEQARIMFLLLAPVEDLGARVKLMDIAALSGIVHGSAAFESRVSQLAQYIAGIAARSDPGTTLAGMTALRADLRAQEAFADDTYAGLLADRYGDVVVPLTVLDSSASNGTAVYSLTASPELALVNSLPARIGSGFGVPIDPQLNVSRWRVAANLDKIRTGRNMAGLRRPVPTYAQPVDARAAVQAAAAGTSDTDQLIPTEPPPVYRFSFLIERARYYVSVAQQLETQLLASFEKGDEAAYSLLKAKQDLKSADANLALQALRGKEASDGVELARLQRDRATFQQQHFQTLLTADLNQYEQDALGWLQTASTLQFVTAASQAALGVAYAISAFANPDNWAKAADEAIGAMQSTAGGFSTLSQWNSMQATFERRREEWRFQRDLAVQDYGIGQQGWVLANDRVDINAKEQDIARTQKEFATQVVDFLSTKFTNKALYDWMGRLLRRFYRDHLNFATVMARQAQQALAFERQEPITIIAPYYAEREKRDLLVAEQLLDDINALDQHRLLTEQRRRELTKTISLASVAPVELEQLRRVGWLELTTPLGWFDRDFPGHYLRLIKSVSLTLVALIPPGEGIRATLAHNGLSRVMVGPPFDEAHLIQRLPESISVTETSNGTGLFELRLDDPILLPFEGSGVETTWRLEVPRGANRFDFTTLADVMLTIRYTALEDREYRGKVLRALGADNDGWVNVAGKTFYSARNRFADEWYRFQNPVFQPSSNNGVLARPYSLQFQLQPADFPPNEEVQVGIPRVVVVGAGDAPDRVPLEVTFTPNGTTTAYRAIGDLVDGQLIVSDSPSMPLGTLRAFGTWAVRVRNEESALAYPTLIGQATGGGRATWDRAGKSARLNVAASTNGGVASASSTYDGGSPPASVINGDRKGAVWPPYWSDNTYNQFPDWIEVDFAATRTIDRIDVITTQDAAINATGPAVDPTPDLTFSYWGITDYEVQYWNGAAWATPPGGSVTGSNRVWRSFTFPAVTTNRIRVVVHDVAFCPPERKLSRIVEVEAHESGTGVNVALAANGATARASSVLQPYPPAYAINGDRVAYGWLGQTPFVFPGWMQIDFGGLRTIDEVDVFSYQDPPTVAPTEQLTFSRYGLTDFEVQYSSNGVWVTPPGGSISGNNKVWRKVSFPDVMTDKIRLLIHGSSDGQVRLLELEAYGYGTAETVWLDDALPAGATPPSDPNWTWVSSGPAPLSGSRAVQSAIRPGIQEYSFSGATPLPINPGDVLFAHVFLDPDNPPSEIMIQWFDGSWEHRAYWGADNISRGTGGTVSRRFVGPLPPVGRWVRLEIPAAQVGLENRAVTGMALLVYGERQLDLSWLRDVLLVPQYQARTRYVL